MCVHSIITCLVGSTKKNYQLLVWDYKLFLKHKEPQSQNESENLNDSISALSDRLNYSLHNILEKEKTVEQNKNKIPKSIVLLSDEAV